MAITPSRAAPQLLDASAFKAELERVLPAATRTITVASAYLSRMGAQWLTRMIPHPCNTTIVVRWRLGDLLAGSSDLRAYEVAKERGWTFRIHQELHAKIWLVDRVAMLVGSGNATARGLSLVENGNWEFGVCLSPRDSDVEMLMERVEEAVVVTDTLFKKISDAVRTALKGENGVVDDWPAELAQQLRPTSVPAAIWVAECFQTDGSWMERDSATVPRCESHAADLSLLGISSGQSIDKAVLSKALSETAAYRWLRKQLTDSPNGEAYFGQLSAALHDDLADDPKPYRQTVKSLLSNLLAWIKYLGVAEIRIDMPRHSQRVALI